jgi:hypothetical protein
MMILPEKYRLPLAGSNKGIIDSYKLIFSGEIRKRSHIGTKGLE